MNELIPQLAKEILVDLIIRVENESVFEDLKGKDSLGVFGILFHKTMKILILGSCRVGSVNQSIYRARDARAG